ncbi:ATP-binding cassette domain-containing protein [Streptomyces sp. NPDC059957]|uniref:ATP-binding cassette domain-containing protein n=1 Tax=unclassified Streptomyces TaxID=2593676 RepID=UPI00365F714B
MSEATRDAAIHIHDVTREYTGRDGKRVRANDGVTLTVERGQVLGLLGPNGAGKTTLVSQLFGLTRPTSGTLRVEGLDPVRDPEAVKRITGFLPQAGLPMRRMEVHRALYFTGRLRGQSERDARLQTRELIEEFGLEDRADRYVDKLSGGSMRLVNIGMALMGRPKVLVLDEPTNELDPRNRRVIWDAVARRNAEDGTTVLLVTHNVLEAESAVHRVAVMNAGRVVASGTPDELKQQIGDRTRLELLVRGSGVLSDAEVRELSAVGEVTAGSRDGSYVIRSATEQVPALLQQLVQSVGMSRIGDFRLAQPSLEDVYLALDGKAGTGAGADVIAIAEAAEAAAPVPAGRAGSPAVAVLDPAPTALPAPAPAPTPAPADGVRPGRGTLRQRMRRAGVEFAYLWLEQMLEVRSTWPWTLMFGCLMPLAMVFGLSRIGTTPAGPESMLYIVSGAAVFALATEGIATLAQRIGHLKSQGQMLYYASLPINKASFVAALVCARLVLVAPGLLTPVLAAKYLFGADVVLSPALLLVLPLSALALAALGMTIGSLIDDVELTVVVTNLLVFVLLLASPVLMPPESLPAPLRLAGMLLPPTYAAEGLRLSLAGDIGPALLIDLLVLTVMAAAGLAAAARWLRWRTV